MKTKLILILTFSLCSYTSDNEVKIADIIDNRQVGWPKAHTDGHQNFDVEIYAIGAMGRDSANIMNECYALVTYRLKGAQLQYKQDFILGLNTYYDKVKYKWVNDSTLKYKLFNSKNDLFENFSHVIINESISSNSVEPDDSF